MEQGQGRGPRWQFGLGREAGLVCCAMLFLEASFASYFLLLPLYVAHLGANPAQVGLIIGIWGMLRIVFLVPSGILVDRVPPVRLIVRARALGVLGLLLAAALPVWWLLPLAFILTGSANVAFPAISAIIAGSAGERDRARAFTLAYTVSPAIATVIAPLLSGKAAEAVGLRVALLLGAGFAALSIAVFSRLTPQPPPARDAAPASYREAFAYGPIRTLCLLQLAALLVLTTGTTLIPNFLREVHGVRYDRLGQLGSVAAIGSILLGLLFARLRPFGRPLAGITAATACTAGTFAILLAAESLPLFALAFLLRGGYMVAWSLFVAAVGDAAPARLYGRALALSEVCGAIGFGVAPFLAGPLYERNPAAPLAAAIAASLPLVAILGVTAWRERGGWGAERGTEMAEEPAATASSAR